MNQIKPSSTVAGNSSTASSASIAATIPATPFKKNASLSVLSSSSSSSLPKRVQRVSRSVRASTASLSNSLHIRRGASSNSATSGVGGNIGLSGSKSIHAISGGVPANGNSHITDSTQLFNSASNNITKILQSIVLQQPSDNDYQQQKHDERPFLFGTAAADDDPSNSSTTAGTTGPTAAPPLPPPPTPSPYYNKHNQLPKPTVHPTEIKIGKLVGEGDFTKTYEVKNFKVCKYRSADQKYNPMLRVHDHEITTATIGKSTTITSAQASATTTTITPSFSKNPTTPTTAASTAAATAQDVAAATQAAAGITTTTTSVAMYNSLLEDKEFCYNKYSIKYIHPKTFITTNNTNETTCSNSLDFLCNANNAAEAAMFETAVKRLVLESLYLAKLQHPFIIPFRAYWVIGGGGNNGQQQQQQQQQQDLQSTFLITDRLGETLEHRIKVWKQVRIKREMDYTKQTEQFILNSLEMDLSIFGGQNMMHAIPKRRKKKSFAIDNNSNNKGKGKSGKKNNNTISSILNDDPTAINPTTIAIASDLLYPHDLVTLQTNYALQIALTLHYLHEQRIIVRDLRPNTIGFKPYPNHHTVQLFNFGFVRELPNNTKYLSPEPVDPYTSPSAPATMMNNSQGNNSNNNDTSASFSPDDLQTHLNTMRNSNVTTDHNPTNTYHHSNSHGLGRSFSALGGGASAIESAQFRRNLSKDSFKSPRAEAKHYRAPESYPTVRLPQQHVGMNYNQRPHFASTTTSSSAASTTSSFGSFALDELGEGDESAENSIDPASSSRGNDDDDGDDDENRNQGQNKKPQPTPTTSASATLSKYNSSNNNNNNKNKNKNYNCDDNCDDSKHQYNGYNCKADIYSLSMIYYEMLAEGKPFGKSTLAREGHYYKIQSQGLRPSLDKYHFPRTIKAVLEKSWDPVIEQRYDARQLCEILSTILHMLEGKGVPTKSESVTIANNCTSMTQIEALPVRASSLIMPIESGKNNKNNSNNNIASSGSHQNNKGWSSVWNSKENMPRLDSKKIMETIQGCRTSEKNKKKPNKRSSTSARRSRKSLLEYIPPGTFRKRGMVKTENNQTTVKVLMGDSYNKTNDQKK